MLAHFVSATWRALREPLVTEATAIGALSGVRAHVTRQMTAVPEAFGAVRTRERPFARVDARVHAETASGREPLLTRDALETLIRLVHVPTSAAFLHHCPVRAR